MIGRQLEVTEIQIEKSKTGKERENDKRTQKERKHKQAKNEDPNKSIHLRLLYYGCVNDPNMSSVPILTQASSSQIGTTNEVGLGTS